MRYIVFILFLFFSCKQTTPEEKAAKAVENYIKENTNDPKSYEPINFAYEKAYTATTPQRISGYKIIHQYRAKNKLGALILTNNTFYLDSSYKVFKVD